MLSRQDLPGPKTLGTENVFTTATVHQDASCVFICAMVKSWVVAILGISGWWFGTFFIFPYNGNKNPN